MSTQTVTLEQVMPLIEQLSLSDQADLLNVISANFKRLAATTAPQPDIDPQSRAERVRAFRGKYRDSLSSTEEFLRRKHEDNEREENRWQRSF